MNKIISASRKTKEIIQTITKIAPLNIPVLFVGETGTGKDFFANLIHKIGKGKEKPFVVVDCPVLQETLADSDLFGHERGAFTGAEEQRMGKFELANGGTIYFDRINLLPMPLQGKLLRVLEDGFIFRLGGSEKIEFYARVIASSDTDIFEMVKNGTFRKDLFFRLYGFAIQIPPLRERKEEIIEFWNLFGEEMEKETGIKKKLETEARKIIKNYDWPGNLRELKFAVRRVWLDSTEELIRASDLNFLKKDGIYKKIGYNKMLPLRDMIREYVKDVWEKMDKNTTKAAKTLGITRKTLKSWLRKG